MKSANPMINSLFSTHLPKFYLLIILFLLNGCNFEIVEGKYSCYPESKYSCPTGYYCQFRDIAGEYRCYSDSQDYVKVVTGEFHSCALDSEGLAWCWGANLMGELGNRTNKVGATYIPVAVYGNIRFKTISAGRFHTCGIDRNDKVWCWGSNEYGQLGDGTIVLANSPVMIDNPNNFSSLSCDFLGCCALTKEGNAWCWGDNTFSQINSSGESIVPTPAQYSKTNQFRDIAISSDFICGVKNMSNSILCQGNIIGSSHKKQSSDSSETNGFEFFEEKEIDYIISGKNNICWVVSDRESTESFDLKCANESDKIYSDYGKYLKLDLNLKDVKTVVLGENFGCGLTKDQTLKCWGFTPDYLKQGVVSEDTKFKNISRGSKHFCGIDNKGSCICWGENKFGETGNSNGGNFPIDTGLDNLLKISQGNSHSCAINDRGEVWCWGSNYSGELGQILLTSSSTPLKLTSDSQFHEISAGYNHTCAIDNDNRAVCWGANDKHQLGVLNSIASSSIPLHVKSNKYTAISVGKSYSCGISVSGEVWCWGRNSEGQLGVGYYSDYEPVPVKTQSNYLFKNISCGKYHTCGVTIDGTGLCWGRNVEYQLGIGINQGSKPQNSPKPLKVHFPDNFNNKFRKWNFIKSGDYISCGIDNEMTAWCWGSDYFDLGLLCNGKVDEIIEPEPFPILGLEPVSAISLGSSGTCGITISGEGWCCGGQMLSYYFENPNHIWATRLPKPIPGNIILDQITVGSENFCGIDKEGFAKCWDFINSVLQITPTVVPKP